MTIALSKKKGRQTVDLLNAHSPRVSSWLGRKKNYFCWSLLEIGRLCKHPFVRGSAGYVKLVHRINQINAAGSTNFQCTAAAFMISSFFSRALLKDGTEPLKPFDGQSLNNRRLLQKERLASPFRRSKSARIKEKNTSLMFLLKSGFTFGFVLMDMSFTFSLKHEQGWFVKVTPIAPHSPAHCPD